MENLSRYENQKVDPLKRMLIKYGNGIIVI